ncbi:heavy-metal-associated domain-containing protein [Undibacterium fentianense]|uniref:Heavy-metal-associated domain-containing protein n=1 Tax=Undibacterium fentianense TaxID=2828728 RepID=A0A941E2D4_9BURK|nr:heavy-metal-associated domain-containing protein [Undibacterium fentianense]MBR7799797.1 heavy-metal-associated domain-containing protein [Undibacterium fentianense]
MSEFHVEDMTCKHCEASITKAIQQLDSAAIVQVDLPRHIVRVDSSQSNTAIEEAIRDAGFTPQLQGSE